MNQLGNIAEDAVLDFKFITTKEDGTMLTLAGSPALAVYKANGTIESTAGVTLTVDFDSRTGMHHARIDTSADAFYAIGNDYQVTITNGTVDGKSVVGYIVGQFSIENRFGGLTTQQIRDAMKLAPSGGAPVAGSVDTHLDDIQAKTDSLPSDPASETNVNANETKIDAVKVDTAAIKLKTDNLPSDPTSETSATVNAISINANIDANETKIDGVKAKTDSLTFTSAGKVDSNLKEINNNSVVGNMAVLTLKQLDVQNSGGTAVIAKSTGGSGHGIDVSGTGTGDGLRVAAPGGGIGIHATGANGMKLDAGSNGYGFHCIGTDGIRAEGGVSDFSGNGITAVSVAGGGTGDGIEATGKGTGHGMELIKGLSGKDIDADEIDDIKAKTDNLPHSIKKNMAIAKFKFVMLDAVTGNPASGFTITAVKKLDADVTWTAMPGSGTIVDNGSGVYSIDIAAADTNGDTGVWKFTASGAETTLITFVTEVL